MTTGLVIDCMTDENKWEKGRVISRAGKVGGKYGNLWNVENLMNGDIEQWNLNESNWKLHVEKDNHEVFLENKEIKEKKDEEIKKAKNVEIEKWKEEGVYEEANDEGQEKVSTTWVISEKMKDEKLVVKARLVARGYEEEKSSIRADSPTCMKNSVRIMLGIVAGKGWIIRSLDVKAAFLQGNAIDRDLYLKPPSEFRVKGKIWRLKKVVYGLCDASRSWYLKVVDVLTELGMKVGNFEEAMFTFKTNSLEGLIIIHVDDMLYAGTDKFQETVMVPLKKRLKISRDDVGAFKYLGINV